MGDRTIPGLPGYLQLIAPESWTRHEIEVRAVPPSLNTNDLRSGWQAFRRHKKQWQEEIGQALMIGKVGFGWEAAIAGAILRFPKRAARRDSGNFTVVLEKALGDAMTFSGDSVRPVNMRYIPDDDFARYFFAGVEFEDEPGPARTRIVLFTTKEAADG